MLTKLKKLSLPALVIIILIIIFLNCFLTNKGIYIFPGDSVEQMYQFYLGGWERFHSGTLSQFDWSLGMGGNVMSYVYYFLTSPFFYITLLFPREWIKYLFLDLNLLKMILLFFSAYYWAGKISKNQSSRIIAGFVITFSGWVFFYFAYNMFLDAFILYPLILGLTEEYLHKAKYHLLILAIGSLGIVNYYFLYMFVPFLCIYTLIRYIVLHHQFDFKKIATAGLKYAGIVLLGIAVSAVILLPCGYLVLSSGRFTSDIVDVSKTIGFNEIAYFFSTIFTPVFDRFNASFLIPQSTHEFIGWGGGCSLFALILTPLLIPMLFSLKDKYKRNSLFISYGLLFIALCFQYVWYLLQRSIDTRWLYMFLFVNVLMIIEVNDELEKNKINAKKLYYSFGTVAIIIGVLLANMAVQHYWPRQQMIEVGIIAALEIVMLAGYVLYYNSLKKNRLLLLMLLSAEAIITGRVFVTYNYGIDHTFFEQKEQSTAAIDFIRSLDHGYYRVLYASESYQIPGAPGAFVITTPNEPFSKNYPGFSFYNTIYNIETVDFYDRSSSNWLVSEAMGRNKINNLMSAKYWITYDYETQIPDYYVLIAHDELHGYSIYQNPYFIELGKTYTRTINRDYFKTLPVMMQDRVMLDYLVTENSDNTQYELNDNFIFLGQLPDIEIRELALDEPLAHGNLYITNFGIAEITISLYNGDQMIQSYKYSQYNYVDMRVEEDQYFDRIVVEGPNNSGVAAFMDVYFEPEDGSYDKWYRQNQTEKFQNVNFVRDQVSTDIDLSEARYIFTSIPYDKGWSVYVNGKKTAFEKVNLGFIGFHLDQGKYHIEFKYEIPYLKLGGMITALSLLTVVGLWIYDRRQLKK